MGLLEKVGGGTVYSLLRYGKRPLSPHVEKTKLATRSWYPCDYLNCRVSPHWMSSALVA